MSSISQTHLARLRPEKLDDIAIQEQISLIQEVCGDIDPDIIAVVFHECDYNMQKTISRLQAGDFEDGGWQTAKSNNKKKTPHFHDQFNNGTTTQSDSERSLSQRTSPTPSQRSGRPPKPFRRVNTKIRSTTANPIQPSETNSSSKSNENPLPIISTNTITSEYQYLPSIDSERIHRKENSSIHPLLSMIPQQAVSMHPVIGYLNQPIDVQFGDIKWNDSIPIAITPSNSPILNEPSDEEHVLQIDTNEKLTDIQTNPEIEFQEPVIQLSSSPLSIPTNPNIEDISHLSDQLNDASQQNTFDYPSSTSQPTQPFLPNSNNPSAFTPYTTPTGTYQQIPRDYSQTWNQQQQQQQQQQSMNYKTNSKATLVQTGNYPQQTPYPLPAQQQYFVGTYPYATPTLYPVLTSVDSWPTAGYESYSTYPTNYLSTYPNQQTYHSNPKHDPYQYDKDFFSGYGQTRPMNPELPPSQPTKDAPLNSKLSATAASFSQTTNATPTFYFNPVVYPFPTYFSTPQDRTMTYPSIDTRDNRNGASYNGGNPSNRTHYQRTHNSSSSWHSQQ